MVQLGSNYLHTSEWTHLHRRRNAPRNVLRSLTCPHFQDCSGCTIDTNLHSPPILRRAETFITQKIHKNSSHIATSRPLDTSPIHSWRHRARLAVRRDPSTGHVCLGLFKAGTHDAVDIPFCQVHHPLINQAADLVRLCIQQCKIQPYDEIQGSGELRYVQFAIVDDPEIGHGKNKPSIDGDSPHIRAHNNCNIPHHQTVQVVLVWNASSIHDNPSTEQRIQRFSRHLWNQSSTTPAGTALLAKHHTFQDKNQHIKATPRTDHEHAHRILHSIFVNFQPQQNNAILGSAFTHMHGKKDAVCSLKSSVSETTVDIYFDPGSFMQANPHQMAAALDTMLQYIPDSSLALADLHAGVGTITLFLMAHKKLSLMKLVEIHPSGEASFWKSLKRIVHKQIGENTLDTILYRDTTTTNNNNNASTIITSSTSGSGGALLTKNVVSPASTNTNTSTNANTSTNSSKKCSSFAIKDGMMHVEYHVAAAGSNPSHFLEDIDVAIVDPPRKGLESSLLDYLCNRCTVPTINTTTTTVLLSKTVRDNKTLKRLMYLSCGWHSFEKDCIKLVESKQWVLQKVHIFLFVPGSDHIETLAIFDRTEPYKE